MGIPSSDDELSVPQPSRVKVRRPHKKSRSGCVYCKRRRIKCDEVKPTCGNCIRSSIPCDYSLGGQDNLTVVPRRRGRPRKDWTVAAVERDHNDVESTASSATLSHSISLLTSSSELPLEAPLHVPWDVEDLVLFYHYITVVANDGQENDLWQNQLPRLAFRHHSVLHLILAISALHLARHEPHRAAERMARADSHMAIGLRQTTRTMHELNEHNCAELYIATILICTFTFARQPGPGHLLVVAEGHEVAWWELFRGVRLVVETIGLAKILATLASDTGSNSLPPSQNHIRGPSEANYIIFGPLEWEASVGYLSSMINEVQGDRRRVYDNTLGMLKWCFQDTFGTSEAPKLCADAKLQTIMAWLYVLEDDYVNMLKEHDPIALVLLAYYSVLLQTLESVWFLRGWPMHIIHGVSEALRFSGYEQWIQWPMAQVKRGVDFIREIECARLSNAGVKYQ